MRTRALLALFSLALAGCGHGGSSSHAGRASGTLLLAVDAPFSRSPYIGTTIANGVQLAAQQLNAREGGVETLTW